MFLLTNHYQTGLDFSLDSHHSKSEFCEEILLLEQAEALAKGHYDSAVLIPANASDFLKSLPVFNREIIRLSSPEAEVCNTDNNASTVPDMCVCACVFALCSLCTVICPSLAYQCQLEVVSTAQ